jgi:carboxymethylenebutenolidase
MAEHIDYYVSLNSPWTHLAAARIEDYAARAGATLKMWPVDFGGTIFPNSGGLPLPKRSPQRQAYRLQELARWREALGIPIHIHPAGFPSDEALSAACVIAVRETMGDAPAVKLGHRVLKALWEEEARPSDPAVLAALIADVGLDAPHVLALAEDPQWATMRAADSAAALARGVFGAPFFVIGDDMFWGQDRLDFVRRRLGLS